MNEFKKISKLIADEFPEHNLSGKPAFEQLRLLEQQVITKSNSNEKNNSYSGSFIAKPNVPGEAAITTP